MANSKTYDHNRINTNAGFSLVELIVVVSILAIAAIPLMKSISMSSRVNAKAQSIQNATSLAEKVMEEVKSTPVEVLKSTHSTNFVDDVMTFTIPNITATQGEKFNATVTINRKKYAEGNEAADTEKEKQNVLAANKKKLPVIEEIDTDSQAVLSSSKELNKYDKAAESFFNEKNAKYSFGDTSSYATLASKTIDIVKKTASGSYPGVTVTATVTYEASGTSEKYVRELYTGTFVAVKKDGSSSDYNSFDSNIYIFYKQGVLPETINIDDQSSVPIPPGESTTDSHRVYFIRQTVGTESDIPLAINFTRDDTNLGTFTSASIAGSSDGSFSYGNVEFITNFGSDISKEGHIYKEKSKIRVYDISVVLTKPGDSTVYADINSTVTASDPTPTPVPEDP